MSLYIRNIEALNGSGLGGSLTIELTTPNNSVWQLSSESFIQNLADYDRYKKEIIAKPTKITTTQFVAENNNALPEFVEIIEEDLYKTTYYVNKSDTKLGFGELSDEFILTFFSKMSIDLKPESTVTMQFQVEQIVKSEQLNQDFEPEINEVTEPEKETIEPIENENKTEHKTENKTTANVIKAGVAIGLLAALYYAIRTFAK